MTSQDNSFDMSRLELLLREHFAQTNEQLADIRKDFAEFRVVMREDMDNFKTEIRQDMKDFKSEIHKDINDFKAEVNTRFDKLEAVVSVLHDDVVGLKHDVAGLYNWDYWLLSIILVVFAMPQIVAGVKSLFGAVIEGIAGIIALFKN